MGQKIRRKGFQLSRLMINHIEFLDDLVKSNALTKEQAVELFEQGLREKPLEVQKVLLPFNEKMYNNIINYLGENYKKIAIWRGKDGTRYIAADYYKS